MNRLVVLIALCLLPVSFLLSGDGDSIPRPVIRPPRINEPIKLTGKLED